MPLAKYRREVHQQRNDFTSPWGVGSPGAFGASSAELLGSMPQSTSTGATGGSAALQGTRMHIKKARVKASIQYERPFTMAVAENNVAMIVCSFIRGSLSGTNPSVSLMTALWDAAVATVEKWANMLEGEVYTGTQGSVRLVRHKIMPFTPQVPFIGEQSISNVYLQEGEFLGWVMHPISGQALTADSSNTELIVSIATDVAYARQQARR